MRLSEGKTSAFILNGNSQTPGKQLGKGSTIPTLCQASTTYTGWHRSKAWHRLPRGCRVSLLMDLQSHLDVALGILLEQGWDQTDPRVPSHLNHPIRAQLLLISPLARLSPPHAALGHVLPPGTASLAPQLPHSPPGSPPGFPGPAGSAPVWPLLPSHHCLLPHMTAAGT